MSIVSSHPGVGTFIIEIPSESRSTDIITRKSLYFTDHQLLLHHYQLPPATPRNIFLHTPRHINTVVFLTCLGQLIPASHYDITKLLWPQKKLLHPQGQSEINIWPSSVSRVELISHSHHQGPQVACPTGDLITVVTVYVTSCAYDYETVHVHRAAGEH